MSLNEQELAELRQKLRYLTDDVSEMQRERPNCNEELLAAHRRIYLLNDLAERLERENRKVREELSGIASDTDVPNWLRLYVANLIRTEGDSDD